LIVTSAIRMPDSPLLLSEAPITDCLTLAEMHRRVR
jgi:hypothetical protein